MSNKHTEIKRIEIALQVYRWRFGLWSYRRASELLNAQKVDVHTLHGQCLLLSWQDAEQLTDYQSNATQAKGCPLPNYDKPIPANSVLGGTYRETSSGPIRAYIRTECSRLGCFYEPSLDYDDPLLQPEGYYPETWERVVAEPPWLAAHKLTCEDGIGLQGLSRNTFRCSDRCSKASKQLHERGIYPTVVLSHTNYQVIVYRDEPNKSYGYLVQRWPRANRPLLGEFRPVRFAGDSSILERSVFDSEETLGSAITWCSLKTIFKRWTPTCIGEQGLLDIVDAPGFDEA